MCYASRNLYQRMELIITCAWTPLSHTPATACHCYLLWADLCIRYYLWGQSTMAGVILHTDPCLMVPGGEQCLSPDHTPLTQLIFQIQDKAQKHQCGDNWANNEDSEFEWSENIWCLNRKIIWISSGSVVHRTRWSVITCTLCHTFWSHQPVKCADHKIIWSTLFWHDVMDAGGINRNISPLSHQTLLSKSEPLFKLLMLSSPDIVPRNYIQGEALGRPIKKEELYFRKWPFTQLWWKIFAPLCPL